MKIAWISIASVLALVSHPPDRHRSLQTATTRAADALGEGANLGSIEAATLADLVIVRDDPLIDITNARKVRTVIKNGAVHTMESL